MRKNIHLPDKLAQQIDDWRHLHKYKTETAAIIDLIGAGLSCGKSSHVYLAKALDESAYKIGYSSDIQTRISALRSPSGSACKCVALLVGDMRLERIAHATWEDYRTEGEWFINTPLIEKWFRTHPMNIDNVESQSGGANNVHFVTLTDDHAKKIKAKAKSHGLSVEEFLKVSAINVALGLTKLAGEN